jgi:hypothetical protein
MVERGLRKENNMGWEKVTVNGKQYDFYRQEFAVECGAASVAMVGKLYGKGMSISEARQAIRGNELASLTYFNTNWNTDATLSMTTLSQALSNRGITGARHRKSKVWDEAWWIKLVTKETTPSRPSILRVYAPYGHFIVCLGLRGTGIDILDPEVGHITVPISSCRSYARPDKVQTNMIDQWVVVTTT